MPPRPFVNDALWRCLCPRWTQVPLRRNTTTIGAEKRKLACSTIGPGSLRQSSRTYGSFAAAAPNEPFATSVNTRSTAQYDHPLDLPGLSSKHAPNFVRFSTEELYTRLRTDAAKGLHRDVMSILRILIKDRQERPNLRMYTALLHSYVSPEWGTAGKIRKALDDMAAARIELDERACECALEALSVHPDSFVRTDILQYMRDRWWTPTPTGQCFVIAGLMRERCFEMALGKLEGMLEKGTKIEQWLWDQAIWMLLEFDEVDEAFHVLSLMRTVSRNPDTSISGALWMQLLDVAGRKHIPQAASMIWFSHIVPGYLKPSTGTCLNILSVASRVGDVKLATDVFRVLSERDIVLKNHHYEALMHCYLAVHDLPAALSIMAIMQESSLKVAEEELHPLYAYLVKKKEQPMNAFMQLQDLQRSGSKIPTAAVNVCIAASIRLGNLIEAIEMYKALKDVAKAGPTTATFNELFRGCYSQGRKELAMYLANEMVELDLKPDRITYDRLILTCIHAGDIDDAIAYYEEMRSEGLAPRRRTHESLIEGVLKARDGRCVALLRDYKAAEYSVEGRVATLERIVSNHFEAGGKRKEESVAQDNAWAQGGGDDGPAVGEGESASTAPEASQKEMSEPALETRGDADVGDGENAKVSLDALQEDIAQSTSEVAQKQRWDTKLKEKIAAQQHAKVQGKRDRERR